MENEGRTEIQNPGQDPTGLWLSIEDYEIDLVVRNSDSAPGAGACIFRTMSSSYNADEKNRELRQSGVIEDLVNCDTATYTNPYSTGTSPIVKYASSSRTSSLDESSNATAGNISLDHNSGPEMQVLDRALPQGYNSCHSQRCSPDSVFNSLLNTGTNESDSDLGQCWTSHLEPVLVTNDGKRNHAQWQLHRPVTEAQGSLQSLGQGTSRTPQAACLNVPSPNNVSPERISEGDKAPGIRVLTSNVNGRCFLGELASEVVQPQCNTGTLASSEEDVSRGALLSQQLTDILANLTRCIAQAKKFEMRLKAQSGNLPFTQRGFMHRFCPSDKDMLYYVNLKNQRPKESLGQSSGVPIQDLNSDTFYSTFPAELKENFLDTGFESESDSKVCLLFATILQKDDSGKRNKWAVTSSDGRRGNWKETVTKTSLKIEDGIKGERRGYYFEEKKQKGVEVKLGWKLTVFSIECGEYVICRLEQQETREEKGKAVTGKKRPARGGQGGRGGDGKKKGEGSGGDGNGEEGSGDGGMNGGESSGGRGEIRGREAGNGLGGGGGGRATERAGNEEEREEVQEEIDVEGEEGQSMREESFGRGVPEDSVRTPEANSARLTSVTEIEEEGIEFSLPCSTPERRNGSKNGKREEGGEKRPGKGEGQSMSGLWGVMLGFSKMMGGISSKLKRWRTKGETGGRAGKTRRAKKIRKKPGIDSVGGALGGVRGGDDAVGGLPATKPMEKKNRGGLSGGKEKNKTARTLGNAERTGSRRWKKEPMIKKTKPETTFIVETTKDGPRNPPMSMPSYDDERYSRGPISATSSSSFPFSRSGSHYLSDPPSSLFNASAHTTKEMKPEGPGFSDFKAAVVEDEGLGAVQGGGLKRAGQVHIKRLGESTRGRKGNNVLEPETEWLLSST